MPITTLPTASAPTAPTPTASPITVYADFTSAACYLASTRTDQRAAAGHPVPSWAAVEYRPRLPMTGIRLNGSARSVRSREVDELHQILGHGEEFEARASGFLPNSRAAIAAYAEACEVGIGDEARRLIFEAYWIHGRDIGDPVVLQQLLLGPVELARASTNPPTLSGFVSSAQRGPISTAAYRRIRDWQSAWLELGAAVDLTVVHNPHIVETGRAALRSLEFQHALAA